MKRLVALSLVCILALFCGCGKQAAAPDYVSDAAPTPSAVIETKAPQTNQPIIDYPSARPTSPMDEYSMPEDCFVFGVDVSFLTADVAFEKILQSLHGYTLNLFVGEETTSLLPQDLKLSCDEDALREYLVVTADAGERPEGDLTLSYDRASIVQQIHKTFDRAPINARLAFIADSGSFVIRPEESGRTIDAEAVLLSVEKAIATLQPVANASGTFAPVAPTVFQTDEPLAAALESANRYLDIDLRYTYTPTEGATATEIMTPAIIGSLMYVKPDGLTVDVNAVAVKNYVSKMNERHGIPIRVGKFMTTNGYEVDFEATYGGQTIKETDLANDITYCIRNGVSGTRAVEYNPKPASDVLPFGGSYIEVDMDSQHIWVYKDGVQVVSSPIVSGSVKDSNMTPTGVYSIRKKAVDTYLVGPTWRDWVYFWMPFFGGYGLHDATEWRTEYGGDIYIQNGSHGCINMPYEAARDTYDNISVGTKVVLYGGAQSTDLLTQSVSGTTTYHVAADSTPFRLDAKAVYGRGGLTYSSSNPDVAVVDENGIVTVTGVGSCSIAVTAKQWGQYSSATRYVTVKVTWNCEEKGHLAGQYVVVTEPGCESDGERIICCIACGEKLAEEPIAATGHSFDAVVPYCLNGCGTANPDI